MANVKDSGLPAVTTMAGTDIVAVTPSGGSTSRITLTNFKASIFASPTITGHATIEGVTATGATGTGKFVFDTSPTLATPVLGVASGTSLTLSSLTSGRIPFATTAGLLTDSATLTITSLGQVFVNPTSTSTSSSNFGLRSTLTSNPASNSTARLFGVRAESNTQIAGNNVNYATVGALDVDVAFNSTGTVTSLESYSALTYNSSASAVSTLFGVKQYLQSDTGTITNAYGGFFEFDINGGTATNSYGVRINNPVKTGAGAVTNNYGLYVENHTSGATLNYPIYVAGGLTHLGGIIEAGSGPTTLTNSTGQLLVAAIAGWPANASGVLTNNGSGTLTWGAGGGGSMAIGSAITSATAGYSLFSGVGHVLSQTASPVNVLGYGASGSAQTTTGSITSGTPTLTLALAKDFVNGQGILVAGAGAAGADLVTTISSGAGTTTLTLANNAGTTVSGALTQHDDTVAIQAAIDAVSALGGGTVDFPDGTYRANGPLDTGNGNAILHVPTSQFVPGLANIVKLRGTTSQWTADFTTSGSSGAIILAERRAGSGTEPAVIYGSTTASVYFENLTVRTTTDPSLDALNLFDALNASLKNVLVDVGAGTDVTVAPTHSVTAIRMPKTQNFGMTYIEGVMVQGYDNGISFSENTIFNDVWIESCKVALVPTEAVLTSFGNVGVYRCAQVMKPTASTYVALQITYQASVTSGQWYSRGGAAGTLKDIDDASNFLHGHIAYSPAAGTSFTLNSATNLGLFDIDHHQWQNQPLQAQTAIIAPSTNSNSILAIRNAAGNAVWQFGVDTGTPTFASLWMGNITPSSSNYAIHSDGTSLVFNAPSSSRVEMRVNDAYTNEVNWDGTNFGIGVAYNTTLTAQLHTTGSVRFANFGVGTATFDASGNISSVSDERLKRDIRPFSRGLESILALDPILYGYTKDSGLDQTKNDYAGFSAQQVLPFIPEAIGLDSKGFYSFADRPVIAALVNAIKELNAKITRLEKK